MPGLAHEDNSAVVRRVKPLVRVGRPGIGFGEAFSQMSQSRAGRSPQPESPVNVNPRAGAAGRRANLFRRIEGACVHIACLNANDGSGGKIGKRVHAHTPLAVNGYALDALSSQAEE